jgi:hypothetical protein
MPVRVKQVLLKELRKYPLLSDAKTHCSVPLLSMNSEQVPIKVQIEPCYKTADLTLIGCVAHDSSCGSPV